MPSRRALPFDPDRAAAAVAAAEPALGRVIRRAGPMRLTLKPVASPFRALVEAIVYQQLAAPAASAILWRFRALYDGRGFPSPEEVLATPDDRLRAAGLSRGKIASLRDLAARVLDGTVPSGRALARLDDEEIVARLIAVRGVGRWTAEMLLVFGLGRPDVLPATDYGVRKGFQSVFRLAEPPTPSAVLERGERWRPWRTVASWYLWRAVDMAFPPGEKRAPRQGG